MTTTADPCALIRPGDRSTVHAFRQWTGDGQYEARTWCGLPVDLTPGAALRSEATDRLINCASCRGTSLRYAAGAPS